MVATSPRRGEWEWGRGDREDTSECGLGILQFHVEIMIDDFWGSWPTSSQA